MATASVTNTFVTATTMSSSAMNTNFTDLVSFLNGSVVHRDGSKAMTGDLDMGGYDLSNLAGDSPLARGFLALAAKTTTQSGITSAVDVTDMSITWNALVGRKYRIQAFIRFAKDATTADAVGYIIDSVPTTYASATMTMVGNDTGTMMLTSLWTADSTKVAGMKVSAASGSGAVSVVGSATGPSFIWVEDIGYA